MFQRNNRALNVKDFIHLRLSEIGKMKMRNMERKYFILVSKYLVLKKSSGRLNRVNFQEK